jgi:uncharacterized OsmC-like protein
MPEHTTPIISSSDELRAAQAPIKQRYREDPAAAMTPIHGLARFSEPGITATVDSFAGPVRAGLHQATGGDGTDACSGDLLMEALAACAGVTLRSVATALGVTIRSAEVVADGAFDARGTLGVDRQAEVGVQQVQITATLDCDASDTDLQRLASAMERYCVVGQSLKQAPQITVRRLPA